MIRRWMTKTKSSVLDPHTLNADPDLVPGLWLNMDPRSGSLRLLNTDPMQILIPNTDKKDNNNKDQNRRKHSELQRNSIYYIY